MAERAGADRQLEQAQYLLFTDELTGLYNRRFYDRSFVEQTARAAENHTPMGMLLIDVDFFKDFNDRHGHQQGDEILAAVGRLISEVVEMNGYPIRYGGDEFAVLLPAVGGEEAVGFGTDLCSRARALSFRAPGGRTLKISLSIGVAHYPTNTLNPESLFENADSALYVAKRQGRDRAVAFQPESDEEAARATLHRFPCPVLIGRMTPLGEIIDHLQTPTPNAVQWIVVGGDAGIGKSRLLQELRERATRHGHILLQPGTTTSPDREVGLLLDALSAAAREHPALAQQMATALSHAQMRQVIPLLPELARYALLSSTDDAAAPPVASQLEDLAVKMMSALCANGRVTLIADDAHLADPATYRALMRLDEDGANLIACLALRNDRETLAANAALAPFLDYVQKRKGAVYLRLDPFNRHETARMMDAILKGSAQERQLLDLICERSRGIPLLVEELLKFLVHRRIVSYRGSHLEVHDLDENDLPSETELLLEVRAAKAVPVRSVAAVSPRTEDHLLRPGAMLNRRYVIERALARGGMSVVYRATMPSLGGRPVAVKEMLMPSLEPQMRRKAVEQFQREAQMLALLDHPNLVEVIDYFEEDESQYLVMSYIDGETLEQWLNSNAAGDVGKVVQWLGDLCDVLCYLHAQKPPILFRDLKPANVMVDHHGRLRLIDFGIAQSLDVKNDSDYVKAAGTPGYAPLEQCEGGVTEERSDIYALGATTYTLLTGVVPPTAQSLKKGTVALKRPRELNPKVPPALDHLVVNMLALDVNERPASVSEVRTRVQSLMQTASSKRPMVRTLLTSGMSLHVVSGVDTGVRFLLAGREIFIGRGEPGQISSPDQLVLHEPSVSRQQTVLRWDETRRQYVLHNESEATNRTLVNGRPVTQQAIGLGDTIRAGNFEAIVALDVPEAPRTVDERPTEVHVDVEAAPPAEPTPAARVEEEDEVAFTIRVMSGEDADVGQRYEIRVSAVTDGAEFIIGGPGVLMRDYPLRDSSLLGAELCLLVQGSELLVCPPTSDTIARLNGKKIETRMPVSDGDTLTWGRTTLLLNAGNSSRQKGYSLELFELPLKSKLETLPLTPPGPLVIGRKLDAQIHIQDPGVSRVHAQLDFRDGGWVIRHLSQTNPTLVNGVRLMDDFVLSDGDEIQISANSMLRFIDRGDDAPSTDSQAAAPAAMPAAPPAPPPFASVVPVAPPPLGPPRMPAPPPFSGLLGPPKRNDDDKPLW